MGRRSRYQTISVEVDVDVSDVLDDISDEALLDEINERKLAAATTAGISKPVSEHIQSALHDLMARRPEQALANIRSAIDTLIPPHLFAAYEDVIAGRYSAAICNLDRAFDPAPSATATVLPPSLLHHADEVRS